MSYSSSIYFPLHCFIKLRRLHEDDLGFMQTYVIYGAFKRKYIYYFQYCIMSIEFRFGFKGSHYEFTVITNIYGDYPNGQHGISSKDPC